MGQAQLTAWARNKRIPPRARRDATGVGPLGYAGPAGARWRSTEGERALDRGRPRLDPHRRRRRRATSTPARLRRRGKGGEVRIRGRRTHFRRLGRRRRGPRAGGSGRGARLGRPPWRCSGSWTEEEDGVRGRGGARRGGEAGGVGDLLGGGGGSPAGGRRLGHGAEEVGSERGGSGSLGHGSCCTEEPRPLDQPIQRSRSRGAVQI